ncbi:FAD-dependent oxidoreductase [Mesorhizobium sp. BAC0120]|uniref:FAD-dependent oxidoreductase n=1 Tax=Mesorhizobium sp. BAC0120 TaxID=3090670 RepID=UPI00298D2210|nr:FAD-dependent oxidoreductase [Mesorhizobium sp. BAC0120]MDW6021137.1 FAD-dependent oxidoreductase [Mesorhizobium sp. BAC0120]
MKRLASVDDLPASCDLAIIGAGPAGLAAAAAAAECGLHVLVLDENPEPGGQIYRGLGAAPASRRQILGRDYERGDSLLSGMLGSTASYLSGATVWMASRDLEIGVSKDGMSRIIGARRILLATGALERPFPILGWTLPGVLTAGAAQGLLKSSGMVPQGPFVLAGTGPLLWLLASQLIAAEAPPLAILDTTLLATRSSVVGALPAFLASPYLLKGLRLMRSVRRKVRVIGGVTELRALGEGHLRSVAYRVGRGKTETINVEGLFLHQGIAPNVNMASAAGCDLAWDRVQLCWKPVTDSWGRSSVPGISIAGDGAGISGAEAAAGFGRLCGLDAAARLGRISEAERDERALPARRELSRYARGRRLLDLMFQPPDTFRRASPDAIVCRCEEITGRQVTEIVADFGEVGPNQLKSYLRCGMGPCQGRLCGLTVTEMIAAERNVSPSEVGYYRLRFPIKPVTLAEIATLPHDDDDVRAVVRG